MANKKNPDRSANKNRNEAVEQMRHARMKLIGKGKEAQATKVLEAIDTLNALDMAEE